MDKNFTLGLDELNILCENLPKEGIFLLRGDLAMGKTTLVQKIAESLGLHEQITSPTFSVLQSYEDRFFHYDIYQQKTQGFLQRGLHEELGKEGFHIIEWGDEEFEGLLKQFGFSYTCIDISNSNEKDKRDYRIYSCTN